MSLFKIAWRSIERRGGASLLATLSVALGVAVVTAVLVVHGVLSKSFRTNASIGFDLIVGPKGDGLQLTLNSLYYLRAPVENLPYTFYLDFLNRGQKAEQLDPLGHAWHELSHHEDDGRRSRLVDVVIPIGMGDFYEEFRVVATTPALFDDFEYDPDAGLKYKMAKGRNFTREGFFEAVVGSTVARRKGLKPGDKLTLTHGAEEDKGGHDHEDAFVVVGVLAPTGTANDRAVFVNFEGFFLLDDHAKPVELKPGGGSAGGGPLMEIIPRPGSRGGADREPGGPPHKHGDHKHGDADPHDHHDHGDHGDAHHHHEHAESHEHDHADCEHHDHDPNHDHTHGPLGHAERHADAEHDHHSHDHDHPHDDDHDHAVDDRAAHDHGEHGDDHQDHAHTSGQHEHGEHEHSDHGHREGEHDHAHQPLPIEQREVTSLLIRGRGLYGSRILENEINEGAVASAVYPTQEIQVLFDWYLNPARTALLSLTIIICVTSGVSILVSMVNSMGERRREIAVMRSLGAGRGTVMSIVLLESIMLALAGGLLGWLGGHAIIVLFSSQIEAVSGISLGFFDFSPPAPLFGEDAGIWISAELLLVPGLILLAILVGLWPAISAYRTDVSRALSGD